jgi:16S rRNA processing protein RimM
LPFLIIGRCVGAQGVDGEVRVQILSDFPDRFLKLRTVAIGEQLRPYSVESAREAGAVAFLRLQGIADATAARALRDQYVYVRSAEAETPPPGALFWYEVIGLRAVDVEGRMLGTVREILRTGANDVYVVQADGGEELLVPAIDEVVTAVDTVAGTITLRPIPGMMPDDDREARGGR